MKANTILTKVKGKESLKKTFLVCGGMLVLGIQNSGKTLDFILGSIEINTTDNYGGEASLETKGRI